MLTREHDVILCQLVILSIMEKKSLAFYHSNNDCGITIDCDVNGARNIFLLLIKMIQNEK